MSARLLVFGLDAGDPNIVRELVAAGRMPTMEGLLSGGSQYPLTEPRGHSYVAERWTTMVTGVGPEIHRYYCWAEYDKKSGTDRPAPLDSERIPRVWDKLSAIGQRIAVLDVPRQPLSRVNGIQLCEWGTHDRDVGTSSFPANLAAELSSQFGEYDLGRATSDLSGQFAPCDVLLRSGRASRSVKQLSELSDLVGRSLQKKANVSEHLLQSDDWDLFFTVIGESHCATHHFWHVHHPIDSVERSHAAILGDVVARTFETVDQTLKRHIEFAGPAAIIVIVLHSGMAPLSGGNELLSEILARLGSPFIASTFSNRIGAVRYRGEDKQHETFRRAVGDLQCDLSEIIDEDTGLQAVHALRSRTDYFPGSVDDALPDLFIEWNGKSLIQRVSSKKIGKLAKLYTNTARTADHTPEGLVVIYGSTIAPGVHSPMEPAQFASKIMDLLGVSM